MKSRNNINMALRVSRVDSSMVRTMSRHGHEANAVVHSAYMATSDGNNAVVTKRVVIFNVVFE
jgi:hypothetical protein